VHLAVLVVLFYVRTPTSLVIPGPEVVRVALMDPTALVPVSPPQPETPRAPRLAEIKPIQDEGVKLEPARKKPKPEPKHDEPPPPPPAPAPALPSDKMGPTGLRGDLTIDAQDFEFAYYLVVVRNKVAGNWTPPAGLTTGGRKIRAVVYFRIGRRGELSDIRIESVSDLEFFDRSALRAVMLSDPLPPLPAGFPGGDLGVHFGFDWEAP
jgi:outer membrane biosynthesis protein TonB